MKPAGPRRQHGRDLCPRSLLAALTGRHPDFIRRVTIPVACDIRTRALLVDLDESQELLAIRPPRPDRRLRRVA